MRVYKVIVILVLSSNLGCSLGPLTPDKWDWAQQKNRAFRSLLDDLDRVEYNPYPYVDTLATVNGVRDYMGGGTYSFSGQPYLDFSNLKQGSVHYYYGYILVETDYSNLSFFTLYSPVDFTPLAFTIYPGFGGAWKPVYVRPTLPAFILSTGSLAFQEECFHIYDFILHPSFSKFSMIYKYTVTLGGVPILSSLFYYTVPMELKAKVYKWVHLGSIPNLDCRNSYVLYERVLKLVSTVQLARRVEGPRLPVDRVNWLRGQVFRAPAKDRYVFPYGKGVMDDFR